MFLEAARENWVCSIRFQQHLYTLLILKVSDITAGASYLTISSPNSAIVNCNMVELRYFTFVLKTTSSQAQFSLSYPISVAANYK